MISLIQFFTVFSHGGGTQFSCRGIQIAVDWFQDRGHQKVTVFVPNFKLEVTNGVEGKEMLLCT